MPRRLKLRCRLHLLAAIAAAAVPAGAAHAVDFVWGVPGDGAWGVSTNWTPSNTGRTPGDTVTSTDNARIAHPGGSASSVTVEFGDRSASGFFREIRSLTIDASTAATPNTLVINSRATLRVNFAGITNHGLIWLNDYDGLADPVLSGGQTMTIAGTGRILLGSATGDASLYDFFGSDITNAAGHTIEGSGGVGARVLTNNGTIRASFVGRELYVGSGTDDNGVYNPMVNRGTLGAVNGGVLRLGSDIFDNANGIIEASGAGSVATTFDSSSAQAQITGGIVRGVNGGVFRTPVSSETLFTNVRFEGDVRASNGSDFALSGNIVNAGTLLVDSTTVGATDIEIQGTGVTLSGAGKITLGGTGSNPGINGTGGVLVHSAGHTIEGKGRVGGNSLSFDNRGLIVANVPGATLTVDPGSANVNGTGSPFVNTGGNGTLRAAAGSTLALTAATYHNVAGIIEARGANALVTLANNTTIFYGTVRGEQGGRVELAGASNVFFEGVTFSGDIRSITNTDFGIKDQITNYGTITIESVSTTANDIEVQAGGASFAANGKVVLGGAGTNPGINGISNPTLTNGFVHTIEGKGRLGQNSMGIVNNGKIIATDATTPLTIDPSATGFTSSNLLHAKGAAGIALAAGAFDINAGSLRVDAGSKLTSASGVTLNVAQGATLDASNGSSITVASGATLTNAGTMNLSQVVMSGTFANAATGTLVMEIGGLTPVTQHDQIDGAGIAHLAGTLDLRLTNGFSPALYGTPIILIDDTGTNISGEFSKVLNNVVSPGKSLAVLYGPAAAASTAKGEVYVVAAVPGDANVDTKVNFDDLLALAQNYSGAGVKTWIAGDFNGSGMTDFDDLLALSQNYGYGTLNLTTADFEVDWALAQAYVPEPTSLVGLLAVLPGIVRRRRAC